MVSQLWVDRDSLSRFRADNLVSQAQGDFETQMAGLNDAHSAVRDAHSDFYTQLGALNEQYAPSPAPTAPSLQPSPSSPIGADTGNAVESPPAQPATGSDQGATGATDYHAMARASAQRAGFDPDVFERQMMQESGLNPYRPDGSVKVSPAGARGIAQIVPKWHPNVNPDDPAASLDYAANLMASNLKQYGNMRDALVAYNGGQGAVNAWKSGQPYDESQRYVNTIMGGNTGDRWAQEAASPQPAQPVQSQVARPSQFGDPQLSAAEAYAACGPAAAVWAARNQGKNPTLREALDLAKQYNWTPEGGMNGIANEKALLDRMGVASRLETSVDWNKVASDAAGGNPVIISTPGHYFTVDDAKNGQFHVGTSGTDLKRGAEWMSAEQIQSVMGNANGVLYVDHPSASAPSVAENIMSGPNLGQGAPTEASSIQAPPTTQAPKAQTADDILGQANDSFSAELDKLNLPSLSTAQAQSGAPTIPGVPDFLSRPTDVQDAVKKAGDVAMNTPKPLFGPQGLGVGDPRIGPPGGEGGAEEGAGSKIGDVAASAEGDPGFRQFFGGSGKELGDSLIRKELPEIEARAAELRAKHPEVTDAQFAATPLGQQLEQYRTMARQRGLDDLIGNTGSIPAGPPEPPRATGDASGGGAPPEPPQPPTSGGTMGGDSGAPAPAVAGNIRLDKYPQEAQDVIQAASGTIGDEATRGVVSDKTVRELAKMSGQSPQEIAANWQPGQAQNAETLFAIRDALADSGKQVAAALDDLRANPTDPQANAAAVAALTQHRAYQLVVEGGTAEMGRGLRSLRQSVDGNIAALQRLQKQAIQSGKTPEQLAQELIRVDLNDPTSIDRALGGGLPPNEALPTGPQSGQLPLFDSQPLPFSKPQAMPAGQELPTGPTIGQQSMGLDAPFANDAPAPAATQQLEMNPAWAAMAEGKKTLFSLVPFHNISIGWGTLFGPAGPDGLGQYIRAQLPGGAKYVEDLKNGPLGEWFTRTDKWPGMNVGGSNPEAGQFVLSQPWRTLAQSATPAVGGFGAGYKGSEAMGGSDEDKFRAGLATALVGAAAGPTLAQTLHTSLWQNGVPLAKVLTFKAMVENGAPEYQAARFTRDLMGGGQLEEIVKDQGMQRVVRMLALAPDWFISQMRLAGSAATGVAKSTPGLSGQLPMATANEQAARGFWLKVAGTGMLATEALQLALTGHLTSQNQPGNLFKLEVPNGDGQTYSAYSLLPGNVEPILTLADNAASGGNAPGPNFPSSAINAGGAFIANRSGIVPRAAGEAVFNARYPGGPAIVPKGTPPGQAAAPELANAASNFAPIGLQTPIQEFTKGAPLPAYLASAAGVKVQQGKSDDARRAIRPKAGAPEPQTPWDFMRDVVTGATSGGRATRPKRP